VTAAGHLARLVRNRLGAHVVTEATAHAQGDRFVVTRERLLELVAFLRRDPDADLAILVDITCVDYGERAASAIEQGAAPRYEVLVQLRSPRLGYRAHIVVRVAEDDAVVPSLTSHYKAADILEREMFEMYGVYPDGHPSLSPVLLYPGFVGHPLRKDYRATKRQPLVPVLDETTERAPVIIDDTPTSAASPASSTSKT
jgi:NADH-quinone oxidoreductase subunit C